MRDFLITKTVHRVVTTGALVAVAFAGGSAGCSSGGGSDDGRGFGGGTGGTTIGSGGGTGGGLIGTGGMSTGGNPGTGGGLIGTGGGSGSGGGPVQDGCAGIEEEAETGLAPVDLIVAVDTSGSMSLEAEWTQNAMPSLVNTIVASGIDLHLVMISGCDITVPAPVGSGQGCPNDTNLPGYLHVNQGVGSTDALNKIVDTYSQWQQVLRPGALKSFLVVTDDNADSGPNNNAGAFIAAINSLDPNQFIPGQWVFNGIFASQPPFVAPCLFLSAAAGTVYADLVIQTQGISGDLCLQQFDPIFAQLATSTITKAPLACEWDIPPPPMGETLDPALVNVKFRGDGMERTLGFAGDLAGCASVVEGWYYDNPSAPTQVLACPETCTNVIRSPGAAGIKIEFGCATEIAIPK